MDGSLHKAMVMEILTGNMAVNIIVLNKKYFISPHCEMVPGVLTLASVTGETGPQGAGFPHH